MIHWKENRIYIYFLDYYINITISLVDNGRKFVSYDRSQTIQNFAMPHVGNVTYMRTN